MAQTARFQSSVYIFVVTKVLSLARQWSGRVLQASSRSGIEDLSHDEHSHGRVFALGTLDFKLAIGLVSALAVGLDSDISQSIFLDEYRIQYLGDSFCSGE